MIMGFKKEVSLKCMLQICPEHEFNPFFLFICGFINIFPGEAQILE